MTTIVTIDMGGTGATHAAGAREALSVPSMTDMGQSYAQANSARNQANTAYGQANGAYSSANLAYAQANSARSDANTTFATINTTFASTNTIDATQNTWISNLNSAASTINTSLGTINTNYQAAYAQANTARTTANDAYGAANTRLSASGGTLSGDLIITGNLTVSGNQTILNTEVLTTEDADIILLSNTSSTPALNAGLIINRGTSTNTFLRWNEALDEWGWSDSGTTTYYFEDLRQGLSTTNTTFGTINTSLGTINTNYQAAYAQANTAGTNSLNAYGQANAAYSQANSAYGAANNRVLKAGDTMTGQLNISSGGLLVTGNVGIGVTTPQRKLDVFGSGILASFGSQMGVNSIAGIHFGYSESSSNVDTYKKSAMVFERTDNHNQGGNASGKIHFLLHNTGSTSASGTNSAVLTLDTDGNATLGSARVGIGTTSPTAALHVSGTSGDGTPTFRINGTAAAATFNWAASMMNSSLGSSRNTILLIGKAESTKDSGYIGFNHSGTNGSNTNFLTFGLYGLDNVLNITGAGNIGIGTTSTTFKTEISFPTLGTSADNVRDLLRLSTSTTNSDFLDFFKLRDSAGSNWQSAGWRIQQKIDSTWMAWIQFGGTDNPTGISFGSGDTTTSPRSISTRLSITGSGNVGIGTTGPGSRLHVQGGGGIIVDSSGSSDNNYLDCRESGTTRFSIYENSDVAYLNSHNTMALRCNQTGGSGGSIRLDGGNVGIGAAPNTFKLEIAGSIGPSANATYDLGSSTRRWATVFTSDLDLNNGVGDWTIVEGEDDLFIYNNKRNKVYKFKLEEVDPSVATPKKENL